MATSVALPIQTAAQPDPIPAPVQAKKFLDHCIEELDPNLVSAFEKQSTVWKVAAAATVAAFIALAVGVFVATGVFAPVYIPIAAIGALLFREYELQIYEKLQQLSDHAAARAGQLKKINHHYQDLTTTTSAELQPLLFRMGIVWFNIPGMLQHPENLATLKPLIARHRFWEEHIQTLDQAKQTDLQKAQTLVDQNNPNNREEIYNLRVGALELERQALECKVKDAFILAVIQRPALTEGLDAIGDFSKLSNQERVIGNAVNDASVNNFFTFKNNAFATLTAGEVKQASIVVLSQRLLAAAPAA